MTQTEATPKQIDFVKTLINDGKWEIIRMKNAATPRNERESLRARVREEIESYTLVIAAYEQIVLPEQMSVKQASALIDALRGLGQARFWRVMLTNTATAERFGLGGWLTPTRRDALLQYFGIDDDF